jgi:hypothetical protein
MSDRPDDRPQSGPRADPTRDIRLPPLPDRPAAGVPPEWSSYVPAAGATANGTPAPDGPAPDARAAASVDNPSQRHVDEPTDRLSSDHPLRQSTRSFTPAPNVQLLKVSVSPRRRRTTKVLWTLVFLTLAVIIACGIYLVIVVTQR